MPPPLYHDDVLVSGLGGLLGGSHLVALESDSRLALPAVGRLLVKRLTDPEGTGFFSCVLQSPFPLPG